MAEPFLLEVRNLKVYFPVRSGLLRRTTGWIRAVDDVSFSLRKGTTTGLVGESGSGKTTIGRAILRLLPVTSGKILYRGQEITSLSQKAFRPYRKKIQMVFQDPYNSLNPRLRIEETIGEALEIHFPELSPRQRRDRIAELLTRVGLEPKHMSRYPHEFSGGQRQRIGIARALAVEPELLVCDEPVSALDVSVQAQIVNLLMDLQSELGLTYLFISHDLALVEHISDEVLVLQAGRLVEAAPAEEIYQNPRHPYTRKLLEAIPKL
jgi:oligopeptide transport system ATP-binding protein